MFLLLDSNVKNGTMKNFKVIVINHLNQIIIIAVILVGWMENLGVILKRSYNGITVQSIIATMFRTQGLSSFWISVFVSIGRLNSRIEISETENANELYPFLYDQFQCGRNERMFREINSTPRGVLKVSGGHNLKVGQAPYMARLRYTSKMNFGGSLPPFHKCGATLISSCWAITAAKCFVDPDEIENDIAGEDIQ